MTNENYMECKLVEAALVDHIKHWFDWESDAVKALNSGTEFTVGQLTGIAKTLGVRVKMHKENEEKLHKLILENTSKAWPDTLVEKFERVKLIVNKASEKSYTTDSSSEAIQIAKLDADDRPKQYSLICKLVWFYKPHGWMFYDGYVSRALASVSKGPKKFNAEKYFKRLSALEFENLCTNFQEKLKSIYDGELRAERVIDKLLWHFNNTKNKDQTLFDCTNFYAMVGAEKAAAIKDVAGKLSTVFEKSDLGKALFEDTKNGRI